MVGLRVAGRGGHHDVLDAIDVEVQCPLDPEPVVLRVVREAGETGALLGGEGRPRIVAEERILLGPVLVELVHGTVQPRPSLRDSPLPWGYARLASARSLVEPP